MRRTAQWVVGMLWFLCAAAFALKAGLGVEPLTRTDVGLGIAAVIFPLMLFGLRRSAGPIAQKAALVGCALWLLYGLYLLYREGISPVPSDALMTAFFYILPTALVGFVLRGSMLGRQHAG